MGNNPDLVVDEDSDPTPHARFRRRRRRRLALGLGSAVLILGAIAAAALGLGGNDEPVRADADLPPATAEIARATLTRTESFSGTLGYGSPTVLTARASAAPPPMSESENPSSGADKSQESDADADTNVSDVPLGPGTITWLPRLGAVIRPGEVVYRVDDRPVALLLGRMPSYRFLEPGVQGADVQLFERNLSSFGYTGFTIDSVYATYTAAAVRSWQVDMGMEVTGTVDVNQIAIAPGKVRVAELRTTLGAEAIGEILAYTDTERVVTVPLDVAVQHLVRKGLSTKVTLPDGRVIKGKVARVGTVATTAESSSGEEGGGTSATIKVVVELKNQRALGTFDAAPVQITLVVSRRRNVLTAPVGALVALAEGGYGVQVVEGSHTRYVAVETGMFGNGLVEISGEDIAEGTIVGVPL